MIVVYIWYLTTYLLNFRLHKCKMPKFVTLMGVESRGTGMRPPVEKSAGDVPPEIVIFQCLFFSTRIKFLHFPTISKISGRTPRKI